MSPLLELGVTPGVQRISLPSLDDEFSSDILSPLSGFPLFGTNPTRFNVCSTVISVVIFIVHVSRPIPQQSHTPFTKSL